MFVYSMNLIRDIENDPYGIKRLQNCILNICVYFDSFCKEHHLTYYLMGGSALGAIRHKGFIPWDDDLDVFMPFDDYVRFLSICNQLDNHFYLQKENSQELPFFFSKLRMKNTICDEDLKTCPIERSGVFIDIMCLNNAPNDSFRRKKQYFFGELLKAYALSKSGYHPNTLLKKTAIFYAKVFLGNKTRKYLLDYIRKFNTKQTNFVGHYFGRARYKNSWYKKSLFLSQQYVSFENTKLAVSNGVNEYLLERYGADYMKLPDEKTKKIYGSHALAWDVSKVEK